MYLMLEPNPSNPLVFEKQDGNRCLMYQKAAATKCATMGNLHGTDRTGSCMVLPSPRQPLLPPDIQVKAKETRLLIGTADINRDYRFTLQTFSILFCKQTVDFKYPGTLI